MGLSAADKQRFHNLLALAANSSFEGERKNALAAAERLAKKNGLTLDEAAAGTEPPDRMAASARAEAEAKREEAEAKRQAADLARWVSLNEAALAADKKRREEALKEAYARGLDEEEQKAREQAEQQKKRRTRAGASAGASGRSRRRMDPKRFAERLLQDTTLPISEIASITGLNTWEVTALKLKMRRAA